MSTAEQRIKEAIKLLDNNAVSFVECGRHIVGCYDNMMMELKEYYGEDWEVVEYIEKYMKTYTDVMRTLLKRVEK